MNFRQVALTLVLILFCAPAFSQQISETEIVTSRQDLIVNVKVDPPSSPISLQYNRFTSGAEQVGQAKYFTAVNKEGTVQFSIPFADLGPEISYIVVTSLGDSNQQLAPPIKIDIDGIRRQFDTLKRNSELEANLSTLRADLQQANAKNETLNVQIAELGRQWVKASVPSIIEKAGDPWVSDSRAVLVLRSDLPTYLELVGGDNIPRKVSMNFAQEHVIQIGGLEAGTTYTVQARAIDSEGNPLHRDNRVVASQNINFTTAPRRTNSTPIVKFVRGERSVGAEVNLPARAMVKLVCSEQPDENRTEYVQVDEIGNWPADASYPQEKFLLSPGLNRLECKRNLRENTNYFLRLTVMDDYGTSFAFPSATAYEKVETLLERFEFKDSIKMDFSPVKVEISWQANREPERGGIRFRFGDKDGPEYPAVVDPANPNRLVATLNAEEFKTMLSARAAEKQVPTVRVFMQSKAPQRPQQMDVAVSFTLPSAQEVQKLPLSKDKKSELLQAIEKFGQDGLLKKPKLTQSEWLQIGFGLLVSLL